MELCWFSGFCRQYRLSPCTRPIWIGFAPIRDTLSGFNKLSGFGPIRAISGNFEVTDSTFELHIFDPIYSKEAPGTSRATHYEQRFFDGLFSTHHFEIQNNLLTLKNSSGPPLLFEAAQ
ncbi:META domain-containing protein [bacterium SCSIO 12741]|nr:META domain-containing protein [bacterium SCSIO 12741]